MKSISKKFITGFISFLLLGLGFSSPAFADEISISLSGNGTGSTSDATVTVTSNTNVEQTNTADVVNSIGINANTGDNTANNNTGGDTSITTGDISQNVDVLNVANTNGTNEGASYSQETNVSISDNGSGSTNNVTVNLTNDKNVDQNNSADIENNVNLDANTGGNSASGNSGGSVNISTGGVDQSTNITNCLNLNWFGFVNPFDCPKPEGGSGDQPPGDGEPSVSPPVTQVLSQSGPTSSSSSSSSSSGSSGEVLGVSILPLTGSPFNIWVLGAYAAVLMIFGYFLIMKSYSMELALIQQKRGRYYNKDSL